MGNSYFRIIFFPAFLVSFCFTATFLSHFEHKPEFTNGTKDALRLFAPLQDLKGLHICHVLPFAIMDRNLNIAFTDIQNRLVSGPKIKKDSIDDLKSDVYKIDAESAFLKLADVRTKMGLFHENANQKRDLEDELNKLVRIEDSGSKQYKESAEKIVNYFYNAPANLRISSEECFNDDYKRQFEDPNLRAYSADARRNTLSSPEITEHSRYLAKKYNMFTIKDMNGNVRTTDQKKSERNPALSGALKEYNKGLNVFEFFMRANRKGIQPHQNMTEI